MLGLPRKMHLHVHLCAGCRSDTVRLVGADKEMLGVMSLDAALDLADEQELDVIVISPDADPPVCRLVSYDKFKYEEEKAKKVQSKKQREGRCAAAAWLRSLLTPRLGMSPCAITAAGHVLVAGSVAVAVLNHAAKAKDGCEWGNGHPSASYAACRMQGGAEGAQDPAQHGRSRLPSPPALGRQIHLKGAHASVADAL